MKDKEIERKEKEIIDLKLELELATHRDIAMRMTNTKITAIAQRNAMMAHEN